MSNLVYIAAFPVGIAIGVLLQIKVFNKEVVTPNYCDICYRDKNLPSHEGFVNGMFDQKFVCHTYATLLPEESRFPH